MAMPDFEFECLSLNFKEILYGLHALIGSRY